MKKFQRIVKRTDAVRFAQLYSLLTGQSKIQELSTADPEIWEQLEPGEFIDIRATATLSTVAKTVDVLIVRSKWLADMLTKLRYDARPISSTQSLSDRHELAIVEPSGQITTRRRSVSALMQRVLSLLNGIEPLPKLEVIAPLIGSPDYKFVAHLDRDHLLVTSPVELAGEVQVLGRLEQKLTSPYRTGGLSPEVIEWLQGLIEKNTLSQSWVETAKHLYVEPPVAVFQPVAIYR